MLPSFIVIYTKQVSTPQSETRTRFERGNGSAKVDLKVMSALASRIRFDSWAVLARFVPLPTFSLHIRHFVCSVYRYVTLFEKFRRIIFSRWPGKC